MIETTSVLIIEFKDISYDICIRWGEIENIESWRKGHKLFFTQEGNELGYSLTEDMPVVFEDFNMVFSKP